MVFKKITSEHISNIEKYIRDEALSAYTSSLGTECEVLVDEDKMIDIFGTKYATSSSQFKFQPGDILLIQELVLHVKLIVDNNGENSGLHLFRDKKRNVIRKRSEQNPKRYKRSGHEASDENMLPESISSTKAVKMVSPINGSKPETNRYSELKLQLFVKIETDLRSHGVNEEMIAQFSEKMVDIEICEDDNIYGNVMCVVCGNGGEKKKPKPKRVYYHVSPDAHYWVSSNFSKHLKSVHKLTPHQPISRKTQRQCSHTNVLKENHALTNNFTIEIVDVPVYKQETVVQNVIDANDVKMTTEKNDLAYTQISTQIAQMIRAVLVNGDTEEKMRCLIAKKPKWLTIANINKDGNCLFGSICHQFYHTSIGSNDHQKHMDELRARVVEYILKPENFPSFEHSLKGRIYEIKSPESIQNMTLECRQFVENRLSHNGCWGGTETVAAASKILQINILIINEDGDSYFPCHFTDKYDRTIVIAYRLNHSKTEYYHYDSVCDIDSNLMYTLSQIIRVK